jgi:uncharacterized DUF497 family protein
MKFTWDETKRVQNLKQHGFDFADAPAVFAGMTFTYTDDRFDYGEERFVSLGVLNGVVISIVHTETAYRLHLISFRKATRHEQVIYFENI